MEKTNPRAKKKTTGLEIFEGQVIKFKRHYNTKIPLISWIDIHPLIKNRKNIILQKCKEMNFYFLHSYFCDISISVIFFMHIVFCFVIIHIL